jgi:hexosaminidase
MYKASMMLLSLALCAAAASATESGSAQGLPLVPSPKEVRLSVGGFRLGPGTKIFVQLGHQEEDRIAAETLAEEIQDQSGFRLNILGTKPNSKAEENVIMLVRLHGSKVRHFLAQKGLTDDRFVGEQGYLLFSDKSHLIVAANSGQGLFSGVQTLRQLLRPEGKNLFCPAVAIRDWPNLAKDDTAPQNGAPIVAMQFMGSAK